MAHFVAISGPSTTGKSSLINMLKTAPEFKGKEIIFSQDVQETVWKELVEIGRFTEFTEITKDSDYLSIYLLRMIDRYNDYIKSMEHTDALVILDGCWIDLAIYSILNMWYTRMIKSIQEEVLYKVAKYDDHITRIYITEADDKNHPVDKYRLRGNITTFRANRPLEINYYNIAKNLIGAVALPSSDIEESVSFIIEDLKKIGYLS